MCSFRGVAQTRSFIIFKFKGHNSYKNEGTKFCSYGRKYIWCLINIWSFIKIGRGVSVVLTNSVTDTRTDGHTNTDKPKTIYSSTIVRRRHNECVVYEKGAQCYKLFSYIQKIINNKGQRTGPRGTPAEISHNMKMMNFWELLNKFNKFLRYRYTVVLMKKPSW